MRRARTMSPGSSCLIGRSMFPFEVKCAAWTGRSTRQPARSRCYLFLQRLATLVLNILKPAAGWVGKRGSIMHAEGVREC
jgi:hypothetical protein